MRDSIQNLMGNVDNLVVQNKPQLKGKADKFIIKCVELASSIEHLWANVDISGRELISFRLGQKVSALEDHHEELRQVMTNNGVVTVSSDSEGELPLKRARSSRNLE